MKLMVANLDYGVTSEDIKVCAYLGSVSLCCGGL